SLRDEEPPDGEAVEPLTHGDALQHDVAANELVDHVGRGLRLRELVDAGLERVAVANELHVDQRDVRVADDSLGLQMAHAGRGAESLANLDQLRGLGVALVRRRHGAPEEISAAGGQEHGEEQHRAEGLDELAAAAASAAGYDALPAAR